MAQLPLSPRGRRTVLLIATVIIVAAAGALAPLLSYQPSTEPAEYPEWEPSNLVPERSPATGEVTLNEAETGEPKTILIDKSHAGRFTTEEIRPLVSALTAAGHEVHVVGSALRFRERLNEADAVVVIDPRIEFTPEEVNAVESFVADGGRLVMVGEPTRSQLQASLLGLTVVPERSELSSLASRFGIEFGTSYLYNMESNDGNYLNIFASATGQTALAEGVDRTAMYTATTVQSTGGEPVLVSESTTTRSGSDETRTHTLAVVDGNVMAIGDKTFITDHTVADNERLLSNVASFLVGADRSRDLLDYPYLMDQNPTVRYTDADLLEASQTVGQDLRSSGFETRLALDTGRARASETSVLVTTYDYLDTHGNVQAGVSVRGDTVSVPGYEASLGDENTTGPVIIHAPDSDIDVVIVADSPDRAQEAATELQDRNIEAIAISDTTAIIPGETDSDDETDSVLG